MTVSSIASSLDKAFEHDQGEIVVILSRFDQKFGITTEIGGKLMQVLTWVLEWASLSHGLLESVILLDGGQHDEANEGSPHQRERIRLFDPFPHFGFKICFERTEKEPLGRHVIGSVIRVVLGKHFLGLIQDDLQRETCVINDHRGHDGSILNIQKIGNGVQARIFEMAPSYLCKQSNVIAGFELDFKAGAAVVVSCLQGLGNGTDLVRRRI